MFHNILNFLLNWPVPWWILNPNTIEYMKEFNHDLFSSMICTLNIANIMYLWAFISGLIEQYIDKKIKNKLKINELFY